METKKTKKADVSRQKGMYFNLGLVLAMAFVISAFEWKSYGEITVPCLPDPFAQLEPIINMPVTTQNIPKVPKPKPIKIVNPIITEDLTSEIEKLEDVIIEPKEPVVDDVAITSMPDERVDEPEIHIVVEKMPAFDDGYEGFMKYLSKKIKYPSQARRMGIEGKVFVEFVIDESGKMTELRTIRGIGAGCDEEAIRVLENAPNWSPGKQRGVPVKVKMVLPINFQLGKR
jgi:protein TonB